MVFGTTVDGEWHHHAPTTSRRRQHSVRDCLLALGERRAWELRGANIMIDEYHHVRLTAFGLSNFAEHDGHVKLD